MSDYILPKVVAEFRITGNTPSSKNGRVWTGTYFIASEYTRKWYKKVKKEWEDQAEDFKRALQDLPKPYYVEFTFIRKTRHKFDYVNIAQAPLDQMKKYKWIDEDDADEIKPYFADYIYDKQSPGLIIKILDSKPKHYDN